MCISVPHQKPCAVYTQLVIHATDPLLNVEMVCGSAFFVGNRSASWWTDRLPCRAADWRAGRTGGSRHFASPGSVIRGRVRRRRRLDTWVTRREPAPHLASLFPTPLDRGHAVNARVLFFLHIKSFRVCLFVCDAFCTWAKESNS